MASKKITPTEEQQTIIDALRSGIPKLEVGSFAGTGKTSLLEMTLDAMPKSMKFLYIVFNKSGEKEAKERFARFDNITVKTVDALAYGNHHSKIDKIGFYKRQDIERLLNLNRKEARETLEAFENFCNSDRIALPSNRNIQRLWEKFESDEIDPSFSYIKKAFHINLLTIPNTLPVNRYGKYSVVMIDEFQDTNPVTLEIAKAIKSPQYIMVGDKHQSIYGFRGASNVMGKSDAHQLYLTNSFRFNSHIANKANKILSLYKGETLPIVGKGNKTKLQDACLLSRTNATMINTIDNLIKKDEKYQTIRKVSDIFDLPISIALVDMGDKPRAKCRWLEWEQNKFASDGRFSDFLEYIEVTAKANKDQELLSALKIVKDIPYERLKMLEDTTIKYNSLPKNSDIRYFLSTIHTAKGLEWDYVKLADDLPNYAKLIAKHIYSEYGDIRGEQNSLLSTFREDVKNGLVDNSTIEEFNLLYVGITRAKVKIQYPSFIEEEVMNDKQMEKVVFEEYETILKQNGEHDVIAMNEQNNDLSSMFAQSLSSKNNKEQKEEETAQSEEKTAEPIISMEI